MENMTFKQFRESEEMDLYYETGKDPGRLFIIKVFFGFLKHWLACLACHLTNHKYVDDGSYAGPDSGRESVRCDRCGHGWSHTYY